MRPWWAILVLGVACNGKPDDTDPSETGDSASVPTYNPDWDGVTGLIDDECIQCHSAAGPGAPVLPDAIEEDIRSGAGHYVVPFDPAGSKLWRVLSGELDSGDAGAMPLGTGPLPAAEVAHVKAWIEAGALLPSVDADSDGSASDVDCDDTDATIHPGADETCDGIDQDCDGTADNDPVDGTAMFVDLDGDGFGNASHVVCEAGATDVATGGDCDDGNGAIHPGATEVCDEADNDCDGAVDNAAADALTLYADTDGDGFGDKGSTTAACAVGAGFVTDETDCNDTKADIHPGADEHCDHVDHDCDSKIDESDAVDAKSWFTDADGDSYGIAASPVQACAAPSGRAAQSGDCDDTKAAIHPTAPEFCDGVDTDCNSKIDDNAVDGKTWFTDADKDSYGASTSGARFCAQPSGAVAVGGDCNDADAAFHPNAVETCTDGRDTNCDGSSGSTTDADKDGFVACKDCDDSVATRNPGATEVCNDVDDDCDTLVDEAGATGIRDWFKDSDGDTHGATATKQTSCSQPVGFVLVGDDCDDTRKTVFPGAPEVCNLLDDNCDGGVDTNALDAKTFFKDADADNHGLLASTTKACSLPSGFATTSDDCDDTRATVFPGATETCNLIDDNCNGSVDDSATDAKTWFKDADVDSHGTSTSSKVACAAPSGFVASSDDCNDANGAIHPGALEVCNLADDDCNTLVDDNATDAKTWFTDADADNHGVPTPTKAACAQPTGFASVSDDCDDTKFAVHPGAFEVCNLVDDDCNTLVDDNASDAKLWFKDADGDGFGTSSNSKTACAQPSGFVVSNTDCNDAAAAIAPGKAELNDGLDNDCDGLADEDFKTWSFAADIQPIFNANCTGCHAGSFAPQGMDLSTSAFSHIVNVASGELPSMKRIAPGSPATSYMFHKVSGTQGSVGGSGSQMGALSSAQIETMRWWILSGANP